MSDQIKELVKRLRGPYDSENQLAKRCLVAAVALEAMAGEVESLKQAVEAEKDEQARMEFHHIHALADLAAERDRLAGEVERLTDMRQFKQNLTAELVSLTKQLAGANAAVTNLANELASIGMERDRLKADVDAASAEAAKFICKNTELKLERDRLKAALERLRDCDWVISLPDRMDAVREIARKALGGDA